VSTAVAVKTPR